MIRTSSFTPQRLKRHHRSPSARLRNVPGTLEAARNSRGKRSTGPRLPDTGPEQISPDPLADSPWGVGRPGRYVTRPGDLTLARTFGGARLSTTDARSTLGEADHFRRRAVPPVRRCHHPDAAEAVTDEGAVLPAQLPRRRTPKQNPGRGHRTRRVSGPRPSHRTRTVVAERVSAPDQSQVAVAVREKRVPDLADVRLAGLILQPVQERLVHSCQRLRRREVRVVTGKAQVGCGPRRTGRSVRVLRPFARRSALPSRSTALRAGATARGMSSRPASMARRCRRSGYPCLVQLPRTVSIVSGRADAPSDRCVVLPSRRRPRGAVCRLLRTTATMYAASRLSIILRARSPFRRSARGRSCVPAAGTRAAAGTW